MDSSTAAVLLQRQGYDVIGITMKLWENPCGPTSRGMLQHYFDDGCEEGL